MLVDSQRTAVLKDLQAAIAKIAVDAGYSCDVKKVALDWLNLGSEESVTVHFFGFEPSGPPSFQSGGSTMKGLIKEVLLLEIWARVDADGDSDDRKTLAAEAFLADLEVALTADITRGGRAIDTKLQSAAVTPMGAPANSWMLVRRPIEIRMQPREYGTP